MTEEMFLSNSNTCAVWRYTSHISILEKSLGKLIDGHANSNLCTETTGLKGS